MGLRDSLERAEERLGRSVERRLEKLNSVSASPRRSTTPRPQDRKPFLKFGQAYLYLDDYYSLDDQGWLTDNIVAFWEHYLEVKHLNYQIRSRIRLMRPAEVMVTVSGGMGLNHDNWDYTHIFVPINEGGITGEDGVHWSLVVISLADGVAFHYNSSPILQIAEETVHQIERLAGKPLRFAELSNVPQQRNGNDCGIYMCMFMEELLVNRLLMKDSSEKVSMSLKKWNFHPKSARKRMRHIIRQERERALRKADHGLVVRNSLGQWT